jgi:hypothetical protein
MDESGEDFDRAWGLGPIRALVMKPFWHGQMSP